VLRFPSWLWGIRLIGYNDTDHKDTPWVLIMTMMLQKFSDYRLIKGARMRAVAQDRVMTKATTASVCKQIG